MAGKRLLDLSFFIMACHNDRQILNVCSLAALESASLMSLVKFCLITRSSCGHFLSSTLGKPYCFHPCNQVVLDNGFLDADFSVFAVLSDTPIIGRDTIIHCSQHRIKKEDINRTVFCGVILMVLTDIILR